MAIREIVIQGDPVLSKKCHPVTKFDGKLADLLDDMKQTLAKANGLGLAAPQVGILRRAVIVVNEEGEMLELVNPEILETKGEIEGLEGCLSVPGKYGMVKRPMQVTVKFQDRHGEWHERTAEGFTARAFCHEIDHLDGVIYVDKMEREIFPDDEEYGEEEEE